MATNDQIAQMDIHQVVNEPGGNGLASPPFQLPRNFLWVFGWHNIEQGVEACIRDGEIIPHTKLKSDFSSLIGRKSFVRRVLLKPPPLEIISTALSKDELELTLTVSIKYQITDPVYVASLGDPIAELRDFFEGITSEFIRSESLDVFLRDEGGMRILLRQRFQSAFTFKDRYSIVDVLKVIPSGDESLIEIKRQTRAATQQRDLIEAEGINRQAEAAHNLEISRKEAELNEELEQRKHEREKEIRELEARSEIMRTALTTLGEVAAAGIDPTKLTKEVIGSLVDRVQSAQFSSGSTPTLPEYSESTEFIEPNQIKNERILLDSIKERVGIVTYDLIESNSKIMGAVIQLKDYEIIFTCSENYPDEEPEARVRFPDNTTRIVNEFWFPGLSKSLAQSIPIIVQQLKTNSE